MARVAELLRAEGQEDLATRALSASADMRDAGYQGGLGAQSTRRGVRERLADLARDPNAEAVRGDLLYAIGWIQKAEEIDREVSAKRHIDRRPPRDIKRR
jgi:hypothetical protein